MPYSSRSETYMRLSRLLTDEMGAIGAKSIAATVRASGEQPQILAASAGASVSFIELCLALAEAPRPDGMREIELEGMGHVMWHGSGGHEAKEREVLLFALHDRGRIARSTSLVDRIWRSCERALH